MAQDEREPKQQLPKTGIQIPVPKRDDFVSFVEKVAGRPAGRKGPAGKD